MSCKEPRCPEPDLGMGACSRHKCGLDECFSKIPHGHTGYCGYHSCIIVGCHNVVTLCSAYCSEHGCKVVGCTDFGDPYCDSHMVANRLDSCRDQDCSRMTLKKYCNMHVCGLIACLRHREPGKRFCRFHNCCVANCKYSVTEAGPACTMHMCRRNHCTGVVKRNTRECEIHRLLAFG